LPYLINVGFISTNHGGVGARGYHVTRRGSKVVTTWGGIEIEDGLEIFWRRSTCYKKIDKRSPTLAAKHVREIVEDKSLRGYIKLPKGWRIQP
jgi:hypothetical protein